MTDIAEGLAEEQKFRQFGANDDQVNEWKASQINDFRAAGATDQQINDYFGVKEPDLAGMKSYVQNNLAKFHESRKAADGTIQKEAATFMEAFDAGWDNSVTGLAKAGHLPDTILPEHAPFFHRLASNVATMAGDLPAMVAGGFAGSMVGAAAGGAAGTTVLPGVGTLGGIATGSVLGAGAGAFAAPAALRKILMDHYEQGDIDSAGEFMSRLAATTLETIKGGTVGALTSGAGMIAKPGLQALGAELVTMTTAGAAMEGHLPEPMEFVDGAVLLGGFHLATGKVPQKLREIYSKNGERPSEIIETIIADPVLKQEVMSENVNLPKQAAPSVQTDLDLALSGKVPKEPPAPIGPSDTPIAKSVDAVLSRLSEGKEPDKSPWYSSAGREEIKNKLYQQLIDRLDPLRDAIDSSGSSFEAMKNTYVLARNFFGWKGKAERSLKYETIDFKTGKVNGEGLEPILKSIKVEEQRDFVAYAMSRRAIERSGEFKETGIDLAEAKNVVATLGEKHGKTFDRLVAFNDRVMQYAVDAELISKESFNNIKSGSGDYIPLMREMLPDAFTGKVSGGDAGLYLEMEGSKRKILNPVEQVMRNTMRVIKAAELNRVKSSFAEMIETSEHGFALGRKIEKARGAENEFSFKKNGETITYETKPEYAESIKSLNGDPGKTELWARMLMAPASWLRTGTVLSPDFIVRNAVRDFATSIVQTMSTGEIKSLRGVFKTPVELSKSIYGNLEAIGHVWKNDKVYQEFLSSGGAYSEILNVGDYLNNQKVWKLDKEAGGFLKQTWNSALSPLEYLSHLSESYTRVAEFKRAGGLTGDVNVRQEAALRAREITIDHQRAGAKIKVMSSFVPFINPGIQGMDRMISGWKKDPVGFSARLTAAITVPTVLNWAINHNDSRYQDAPNWEKDLYWIIPTDKWEPSANMADTMSRPADLRRQAPDGTWEVNNGTTLRIPKPFELGVLFGSVPERILTRFVDENPRAGKEIIDTIIGGVMPNVIPTAFVPIAEQATNRVFFTGRPVVSSHAESFLPEYQYNEYTSTTAKQLGKMIGYVPGLRDLGPKDAKLSSPMVVDNYIREWTGTLGRYALQFVDATQRKLGAEGGVPQPISTLADMPIIKAFIMRHPSAQLQPIQDFYDDYEKASRVNTTINSLMKSGNPADYQEAIGLSKKYSADMMQLTEIKKAIGAQAKFIQSVNSHPAMSPGDKRQLMDAAYYQMSMIAKQGNTIIDANRKALNAQQ